MMMLFMHCLWVAYVGGYLLATVCVLLCLVACSWWMFVHGCLLIVVLVCVCVLLLVVLIVCL